MDIVVRSNFGIRVRDAMRTVLGALPTLPGIEVGAGLPDKRFDRDDSSPLDTWCVGIRQRQADKAKGNSHEKEAKKKSFG